MSRDNWERLVAAVLKREDYRQLCYQHSRNSSDISTISSDDFSGQFVIFPSSNLEPVNIVTPSTSSSISQGEEDLGIHLVQVHRFSLHELQVATDNFSEKNILKYGYNMVYKGRLADGFPVAIKRHKDRGGYQTAEVQFRTEVKINSIALHPNVLHMLGFCITSNERLIVYPLLANGSVASCLRGSPLQRTIADVLRMSSSSAPVEERVFIPEFKNSFSNRKLNETPKKMLIAQEMSKEVDSRWDPPNFVTKLMGHGALPQQRSQKSPLLARYEETANDRKMAVVRQKFVEAKRLSMNEKLRQSKKFQDALEVLNSNKDLFLKYLQEPDSMFSENLYSQQSVTHHQETKRIIVRRPSKLAGSNNSAAAANKDGKQMKKGALLEMSGLEKAHLEIYPPARWKTKGGHKSQSPLNWSVRKGIALSVAKGLAYLHGECDPQIIHGDVKASNIYLDEHFEAVVGNFDLAVIMDYDVANATTSVVGTTGCIPPEYLASGTCSDKTDVFGYGVFLLELITGHTASQLTGLANEEGMTILDWTKKNLEERKWETMADPDCGGNGMEVVVEQLTRIALLCTRNTSERRPKMSGIVRMLEVETSWVRAGIGLMQ